MKEQCNLVSLALELSAEGPLSKKQTSTYLFTYRYSTLKLFEALNFKIGTDAVPNYQDASFHINLPLKKGANLSFFGIGGTSKIDIILSKFDQPAEEIYGENNKDQYFRSDLGVVGISYTKAPRPGLLFKGTLAHVYHSAGEENFIIYRNPDYRVDSLVRSLGYRFKNDKTSLALSLMNKINVKNIIKLGMQLELFHYNLSDSVYQPGSFTFLDRIQTDTYSPLLQSYVQWKYKWSEDLEMNSGIHFQYSALNHQFSIEPRFALHGNLDRKQSWSAAAGWHSQLQPYYIYFYKTFLPDGTYDEKNRKLGFSKSFHSTLGYERTLSSSTRLKLETYYIKLSEIPIHTGQITSYSVINEGGEFGRFFSGALENSGTGYNLGFEATLEKTFSSGYYFLLNSSCYQSKYKGSDQVWRNTAYNANFSLNALFGTELFITKQKNKMINIGSKISYAGGRRYSPADIQASSIKGELVLIDQQRNSLQFKNYFRMDLKLGYKINARTCTHEFGMDLVNVLNTKNVLALVYAPDPRDPGDNPIKVENQLGFLPLFFYRFDFTLKRK